jgi:hypothetical protein
MTPWLATPPPDVKLLPLPDLVALWRANRSGVVGANTVLGHVAADEIALRVERELIGRDAG